MAPAGRLCRAIPAVLSLVALVAARPAGADLLQDLGATFQQVARDLAAAFPKVETQIVAVEGEEVRLQGPGVSALRPGLELVAYRKGELFRHPITNQPLGRAEEEIATLVVTAVTAELATARVEAATGGQTPAVGDGARITAGRLAVAVLPPLGVNAPFESADHTALLLVARFSGLLEKTGRFLTVEPRRTLEISGAAAGGSPPSALEVARRLGVPAALSSRLVQEGRARFLEVAWISARTGATLVTLRAALVRAVFPPRFAWEQTPELERRIPVEGAVRGLALADLDGDGRPELVLGDERGLVLYRWQEGAGLTPTGTEFHPGGLILSVDAADVNGVGRAQVVVVDYRGTGRAALRSRVLELGPDGFRTLYDVAGRYLRVVPVGSESWLLEQAGGDTEPFERRIRRLVWDGTRYRDGLVLRLPGGVSVYGLALLRLTGSAEPEVVALTAEDRLAVWTARGQRLWTSADPYGGAAISFPYEPIAAVRTQAGRDAVIGRILGRVIPVPEAPDGPELLVFENLLPLGGQARALLPRLAPTFVNQGRVHRLRWKDGGFVRVWQSTVTEGYIADFAFGDLDGDTVPEVVVGIVPRGFDPLARPQAHLGLYELP